MHSLNIFATKAGLVSNSIFCDVLSLSIDSSADARILVSNELAVLKIPLKNSTSYEGNATGIFDKLFNYITKMGVL